MVWRVEPDGNRTVVTREATVEVPGGPPAVPFGPLIRADDRRKPDATLTNLRTALDAPDS